jgi:hypothetical protein
LKILKFLKHIIKSKERDQNFEATKGEAQEHGKKDQNLTIVEAHIHKHKVSDQKFEVVKTQPQEQNEQNHKLELVETTFKSMKNKPKSSNLPK